MANDYLKKEPSKTEKMLYELAMNQHQMERSLWSISSHAVAMGILLNIEPEKLAELLVNGNEKIKDYGEKVNEAIKKLEPVKKPEAHHQHDHERKHPNEHQLEES